MDETSYEEIERLKHSLEHALEGMIAAVRNSLRLMREEGRTDNNVPFNLLGYTWNTYWSLYDVKEEHYFNQLIDLDQQIEELQGKCRHDPKDYMCGNFVDYREDKDGNLLEIEAIWIRCKNCHAELPDMILSKKKV